MALWIGVWVKSGFFGLGFFFSCVLFLRLHTISRACPQDLGVILFDLLKTCVS